MHRVGNTGQFVKGCRLDWTLVRQLWEMRPEFWPKRNTREWISAGVWNFYAHTYVFPPSSISFPPSRYPGVCADVSIWWITWTTTIRGDCGLVRRASSSSQQLFKVERIKQAHNTSGKERERGRKGLPNCYDANVGKRQAKILDAFRPRTWQKGEMKPKRFWIKRSKL